MFLSTMSGMQSKVKEKFDSGQVGEKWNGIYSVT